MGGRLKISGNVEGSIVIQDATNVHVHYERAESVVAPTRLFEANAGVNPFKGLLYFEEVDANRFFGREKLIGEAYRRFIDAARSDEGVLRILPVLGPSGSGKSSLIRAGLVPQLARERLSGLVEPRVLVLQPGQRPLEALARALARFVTGDLAAVSKTREFFDELKLEGRVDGLRRIGDGLPIPDPVKLILVIDQFEEIYVAPAAEEEQRSFETERDRFVATLLDAAVDRKGRLLAILVMRSDFFGATQRHPALNAHLARAGFLIPAMGKEELERAIREPARLAGRPFPEAFVDLLVNETLGRPGALPLLQFALQRVWDALPQDPADTLEAMGGVAGAVAAEADKVFEGLSPHDQAVVRRAFLSMVNLGEGTADTRRRARLDEIVTAGGSAELAHAVLARFARPDARFITLGHEESGIVTFEVAHEALLQRWGKLREWLDIGRNDQRFVRRAREAAELWSEGRGGLWGPPDLDLLRRFAERAPADVTESLQKFLEASRRHRNIASGIRYAMICALVVLTIVAGSAAWSANRSARQALSRQLAAQSLADVDALPQRSLLLASESVALARDSGIFQSDDAARLLHKLLGATGGVPLAGHESAVTDVAFNRDGRAIATGSDDATVRLWDAARPRDPPIVLGGHAGAVKRLAFSPDGHWLAAASADGTARLWDATHPQNPSVVLSGHKGAINALAISADSRWLATASEDRTVRLWDLKTADPSIGPIVLNGHTHPVTSVAFSRTGKWLATASHENGMVWLWDMMAPDTTNAGRKMTHKAPLSEDVVNAIAFSTDERRLAVTFGYVVQLWDLTAADPPAVPLLEDRRTQWILTVGFSPDGHWLATAGIDAIVKLWDLTAGDPAAHPIVLRGHLAAINALAFASTGRWLATAGEDRTVRLWDLADPTISPRVLRGHESAINALAFSPDGLRLATASNDPQARLWDIPDASLDRIVLCGHDQIVRAVAFSPDAKRLATVSDDRTARLWDVTSPQDAPLVLPAGALVLPAGAEIKSASASFSPDGRWLATATDQDRVVRLWDLTAADPSGAPIELGPVQLVKNLGFRPGGHWLASAGWDGKVRLWNLASGTPSPEPEFLCRVQETVQGLAFSADGGELATGGYVDARLWKLTDENPCTHPMIIDAGRVVWDLSISPDGRWLATASWKPERAKLWRLTKAAPPALAKDLQFKDAVDSVAFSPDAHWMAAASRDYTAQLLDVTDLTKAPLLGHQGRVFVVAFSPDGQSLATLSEDHTVRVWHPARPAAEPVVLHDEMGFSKMAFSPEGRWLATGSNDGTVRLWWLGVDDLIHLACRTAGRNLTEDEWHTFRGGSSYHKTCPNLPGP